MRVAVYFTPPAGHPLVRSAAAWLGRDAFTGESLRQPGVPGVDARELAAITAEPRRYGFHATLKAPFRLADGAGIAEADAAARSLCSALAVFPAPRLSVEQLGGFIALTTEGECAALQHLADKAVRVFEPLRAPLEEAEIARRRAAGLSAPQRRYLERWGYPYVFDEFRFHMTLTGSLEKGRRSHVLALLRERFRELLQEPLSIDAVALFVEPGPGADFRVHARYPLAAGEAAA